MKLVNVHFVVVWGEDADTHTQSSHLPLAGCIKSRLQILHLCARYPACAGTGFRWCLVGGLLAAPFAIEHQTLVQSKDEKADIRLCPSLHPPDRP